MKNAFTDEDGVLKAWGFVEQNGPDEIKVPVSDDFNLEPRKWQWDGDTWRPYPVSVTPS